MSSALLWILLPAAVGIALLFYRRNSSLPLVYAAGLCLLLTWIAWQLPIDAVMDLGPVSVEIAPNLVLFGRNFTLNNADRPLLTLLYLAQCLWLLGAFIAKPARLFASISLIAMSLFVAALSVDPFLYAALIIAMVVLISVPLLLPPGKKLGPGLLRFLSFQLFAVPFILFTGWMLTGVEASPGNLTLVVRSGLLLGLGFTFLLALFPFHSWIPMLAREAHPYVYGFLVLFLPSISTLFALSFLDRYAWLRDNEFVYQIFLLAGTLGVLLGGLRALTQKHLGRMFGYAAMAGVGASLQAIGIGGATGVQVFFALLLPQAFCLWLWALALSVFWRESAGSLELAEVQKSFAERPIFLAVMLLAIFSLTGMPLLASFPGHLALWRGIVQSQPLLAVLSLLGSLGLLGAALRVMFAWVSFVQPTAPKPKFEEGAVEVRVLPKDLRNPYAWAFLGLASLGLLGFGLLSRLFLSAVPDLAAMFPLLLP
jgi:formate hydrogenlyase subunit 3/multisubunit Na+/H+ antiporter MnhD subunit